MPKIILASESKDRKELLENAKIEFQIIITNINEGLFIQKISDSIELVKELAKQKALKAKSILRGEDAVIIAADTIVNFREEIIGKPSNQLQAFQILKKLQGESHDLITGLAITRVGDPKVFIDYEKTSVEFDHLTDTEINNYLNSQEWKGRAGAYSIRDKASLFIKSINGSSSNVIGLPMNKIFRIFKQNFDMDLLSY